MGFDPTPTTSSVSYDIIVAIGQSNMTGRGTVDAARLDVIHPRVFTYDAITSYANQISQAAEPLGHYDWPSNGVGPAFAFAKWYADSIGPGKRVLIVAAGEGDTGFSSPGKWLPTGVRYTQAISQANAAVAAAGTGARIVAFVWLQGEFDIAMSSATYRTNLEALIDGFRTSINTATPSTPFILGQMVPEFINTQGSGAAAIDAVHQATPGRRYYTAFAAGTSGTQNGDNTHYNAVGARNMGRSMFLAYQAARANVAPVATPGQVTGLAGDPSGGQVALTWTGVSAYPSVTDYLVEYKLTSSGSWSTFGHSPSSALAQTVTGLTNNSSYDFRVSAVNPLGTGTASSTLTLTPAVGTPPAQVTGLVATPDDSQVTLTWTAPSSMPTLTNYLVEYKLTSSGSWLTFSHSASTATSIVVTTLANNSSYDFRVSGINSAGTGTASSTASATPVGSTTIASDTFTRADNATSVGTTESGGLTWVQTLANGPAATNFGINTNKMQAAGASGQASVCLINASTANYTITCTLSTFPSSYPGLCFWATDHLNHYFFRASNNLWRISKVASGSASQIWQSSTTPIPGDVVSLTTNGDNVTVKVNGTILATVARSTVAAGTKVGFWCGSGGGAGTADNFSVKTP